MGNNSGTTPASMSTSKVLANNSSPSPLAENM